MRVMFMINIIDIPTISLPAGGSLKIKVSPKKQYTNPMYPRRVTNPLLSFCIAIVYEVIPTILVKETARAIPQAAAEYVAI